MWLTKNERKLLRIFYQATLALENKLEKTFVPQSYPAEDLVDIFRKRRIAQSKKLLVENIKKREENLFEIKNPKKRLITYIEKKALLNTTLEFLEKRELLKWHKEHLSYEITLSVEGFDLGRKYSNFWTRSGLWFEEYKNHWIWLVAGFIGGILGSLVVNFLSKLG